MNESGDLEAPVETGLSVWALEAVWRFFAPGTCSSNPHPPLILHGVDHVDFKNIYDFTRKYELDCLKQALDQIIETSLQELAIICKEEKDQKRGDEEIRRDRLERLVKIFALVDLSLLEIGRLAEAFISSHNYKWTQIVAGAAYGGRSTPSWSRRIRRTFLPELEKGFVVYE